jgi:glycosyltransferase involved in cell wall biosynthesis
MNEPMVTCVIPCHNHRHWVWGAVESCLQQTYQRKRVVVVDDGSTDESMSEVVAHLENPRQGVSNALKGAPYFVRGTADGIEVVVVRYGEAYGPSFARNRGIEAFAESSDLFAFLDSDDLYMPRKLELSVKKIISAPEHVGAVYSDFETVNPDGLVLRQFKEPFSRERLLVECLVNCDSVVSKAAIAACGGFDEEMRCCEDYDLWVRISEKYLIMHIPEALVTIRVGPHSSSATVPTDIWQRNWQRVMLKARARAGGKLG